jgi:hypothetical protein
MHALFPPARAFVVAAALLIAPPLGAQERPRVSPAELPEAEFRSLVEKTNLYVKALNAVSSAQRTYDRYASWVDVNKGPTGKERYISYGLYEISPSRVDDIRQAAQKGPALRPALPELDEAVVLLSEAFTALAPLVNKAHDYYERQDFKDDAAKGAEELHAAMMPLFRKTFAAEAELRRGLDALKADLDRRQLAQMETQGGRDYHWHLRSFMLAAKPLINLLPENPNAPFIDATTYRARYDELEAAHNALESFKTEHPDALKKVIMASLLEIAVNDFFTASKLLRRVLENKPVNRTEYIERVGDLAENYNALIQRTNSLR